MKRACILFVATLALAACARSRSAPPLPGDSVSEDGSVTLTPARFSTTGGAAAPARANEPIGALESRLYPAELVMEHQGEIALTAAQRDAITKEVEATQKELLRTQWELDDQKEKLVAALDGPKVDEAKSKAIAAALMEREDRIKATHLAMLVRIKNTLTADQQDKLRAARADEECPPPANANVDQVPKQRDAGRDAR